MWQQLLLGPQDQLLQEIRFISLQHSGHKIVCKRKDICKNMKLLRVSWRPINISLNEPGLPRPAHSTPLSSQLPDQHTGDGISLCHDKTTRFCDSSFAAVARDNNEHINFHLNGGFAVRRRTENVLATGTAESKNLVTFQRGLHWISIHRIDNKMATIYI